MSVLGNRVVRREDPKLLTSGGTYVADLDVPGTLHLGFVRSVVAHGTIASLELEAARSAPGVVALYSAADIDAEPIETPVGLLEQMAGSLLADGQVRFVGEPVLDPAELSGSLGLLDQETARPLLAEGKVRFVGEPVVAVLAESPEALADAMELVVVDYDPLPAVVDLEEALEGETLLFEKAGTNVVFQVGGSQGSSAFDGCEVVARQRMVNQRVAPCPLEVRGALAEVRDGRLRLTCSTQHAHGVRSALVSSLGLERGEVQVVTPDVGGGFGAKAGVYPEEVLAAWCARALGRPVRYVETRSESMLGLGHGRAQLQDVTIGGTRDGRIEALRLDILQDSGAYADWGAVLPFMTRRMASGCYSIGQVEFEDRSVLTNTVPTTAYRGAGRPEAAAAIERAVDCFAAECGLDPAEVRRRNFVPPDAFPFKTAIGTEYDSGDYGRAFEVALEMAGYEQLRAEQARRRAQLAGDPSVRQLGIGLSSYVEITGAGQGEFGAVEVRPDGRVVVRTGTSPHGQGHVTVWSMIVSDALGVPMDDIEILFGDTDVVPRGGGTMGSRSLQLGGTAVSQAATGVVERARQLAAELLEADPRDVVLDKVGGDGAAGPSFHVAGTPALSRSWRELAAASLERGGEPLAAEVDFASGGSTFPFGTHVAVVEVDVETGQVRLLRHVAVDDAGRIMNPLIAEGQVHGGVAQGAAQALLEHFAYDDQGNPLTASFADYPFISATELPSFETAFTETPTPRNLLGAKGIGEAGTIGSTPAVHNAVCDALAPFGVRHLDMPVTPAKVFAAIQAAGEGG